MMTSEPKNDVLRYTSVAAARYASRSGDDPEEIEQRILQAVSCEVRDGVAPWALVVTSVRNAIANIAKHDRRARRTCDVPTVGAHNGIPTRDRITDQERAELRLDINACLSRESANVRRLCRLLETMTLTEAAREMGVARSTLRGWLKALRDRMEAKGLSPD